MDYNKGDVFRLGTWPFADAVIVACEEDGTYTLARPHGYASDVSRYSLVQTEIISHIPASTLEHWEKIDSGRIR